MAIGEKAAALVAILALTLASPGQAKLSPSDSEPRCPEGMKDFCAPPGKAAALSGQGEDMPPQQTDSSSPLQVEAPRVQAAQVPDRPPEVVKNGAHFMLMDQTGLMPQGDNTGLGLYRDDTRFLKTWDIKLNAQRLTRLYGRTDDGYGARYLYSNKNDDRKGYELPNQRILVEREIVITDALYEKIKLDNFDTRERHLELSISYGNDFADMFEVRGFDRRHRGSNLPETVDSSGRHVVLGYKGQDGKVMCTQITFEGMKPDELGKGTAQFRVVLKPRQAAVLYVRVATESGAQAFLPETFSEQKRLAARQYEDWRAQGATIATDNTAFNQLLERSYRDIYMLRQPTPRGMCIAAGIPWFCVAFGRDQEVTSLETLPLLPGITRQTLALLAEYQGGKDDPYTDEKPGRIMHELRLGEMARLREIPFVPYYGTVDATPLWLVLLGEYVEWTGDLEFARAHWSNVEAALRYLERETENGFLTYGKQKTALSNQGWKDSEDSVMYENGDLARPPIALCEAQGYLYHAWLTTSELARRLGKESQAGDLESKAKGLKARFQSSFWDQSHNYVALALDGEGRQCKVVSSNPGHLLFTGILSSQQASAVAQRLLDQDEFCGWGIRTLSSSAAAYNPMSYHDGSVWPHDNAIIASGLSRLGRTDACARLADGLFKVAQHEPNLRLPELFCGFAYPEGPVWYPVACSPQAWAAGSMFMTLSSCLGLKPDASKRTLRVINPVLPQAVSRVDIKGLRIGKDKLDLHFVRSGKKIFCTASSLPSGFSLRSGDQQ
jgi:glycogen debranching enzyme